MTRRLIRVLLSAALFAAGLLVKEPPALRLFLLLGAYALAGWDVLWYAVHHLINGQVFDENLLMSIATVGAIAIGEYPEATAVMLFYQVGELFQSYAVDRSRRSIAELMDLRPEEALLLSDGRPVSVSPEEVQPGQLILVRPGGRIPLDGVVREGGSSLDTAALTGEAMPRDAGVGDAVLSGAINLTAPLTIEVSAPYGESTVARILDLVENASNRKSQSETFITRFSAVYTPVVVILAALLAAVPPLLFGQPFQPWLYRALQFLVVSCPCALVVSIPLSFFGGIGGAGRQGILVKGSNYLEALAQADQVVFDKTGTLTQGVFAVTRVMPRGMSREELLRLAAHAEAHSAHPIAQSLRAAWGQAIDFKRVTDVQETGGRGLQAMVDGRPVLAGNAAWMAENGLTPEAAEATGTLIHIAADGRYAGSILIADQVKPQAAQAVQALHAIGVRRIAMLTGDSEAAARLTAQQIGIDEVHHSLLPQDKVALVDGMLAQKARGKLCFVGDGINDAPVLARADVGVAMGGLGSGAAIEAADIVLMDDNPMKLPLAIRIARKTLRIAQQNALFAIGVKVVVLALSALGYASLWSAVFADVGVTALAVLNALRTLRKTV